MINLSVVINTKNSQKFLKNTLESVKDLADEIVIVDMKSTDDTLKIAKEYTDHIFSYQDMDYVEPARNFAISQANGIWVLIVDSDEIIPHSLAEKILQLIESDSADCYYLPRKNIIFNKWIKHTRWWPDNVLRLFKKEYVNWTEEIHSIPITTGKVEELPPEEEYAIEHHNYQHVDQFIERLNRYTTIQSKETDSFSSAQVVEIFKNEFLSRFFYAKGYLDGSHGLALSFLQAFSEVTRVLKNWEKQGFSSENNPELVINQIADLSK